MLLSDLTTFALLYAGQLFVVLQELAIIAKAKAKIIKKIMFAFFLIIKYNLLQN